MQPAITTSASRGVTRRGFLLGTAMDRRVRLMQAPIYRSNIAMCVQA